MTATAQIGLIGHNESTRLAIEGLLRGGGFEVHVFPSAEDFCNSPQVGQLHCLLINSSDGPTTFRELAERLQGMDAAAPIILFSSQPGTGLAENLSEHGVVAYLTGPVEWEPLRLAISIAMKGSSC